MRVTQTHDAARLDEFRSRFEKAAYDFPSVDAVVVFRPDLRRDEAERQARNRLGQMAQSQPGESADPELQEAVTIAESSRFAHEAKRHAAELDGWIPPSDKTIYQLGGQEYWSHVIRDAQGHELWQCTLFGLPAIDLENTALRRFNMLAGDIARLILPRSEAKGKALLSFWLIFLADREEPLEPGSRRRFLHWPRLGGVFCSPDWIPVTPQNPQACWWAVRLSNVFSPSGKKPKTLPAVLSREEVAQ